MLTDDECQGIFLTDAARILRMTNVVANVVLTMSDTAYAFRTKSVRAFGFWAERMPYGRGR